MARTALDLTPEELRSYRPELAKKASPAAKRCEQAWEVARRAAHLLREKFSAKRVVAFGSLVHRDAFTRWSDIDLAAWGIPAEAFYRTVAAVTGMRPDFEIDPVDVDDSSPRLRQTIEREGIEL